MYLKNEDKIQFFKQKLREYVTGRPTLQDTLEQFLMWKGKTPMEIWIYTKNEEC